jgi:3-methyladenine DNA glycosylase AlkD
MKTITKQIIAEFKAIENKSYAQSMSNYMKGHFVFFGVNAPLRKAIQKHWFPILKKDLLESERWDFVHEIFEEDQRELQYFAIDFINSWPKNWIQENDGVHLEKLLLQKQWWDTVDSLAGNYVGMYFKKYPAQKDYWIKQWRSSSNFWLNRTCLIFQLKYKDEVDFELMKALILAFKGNKEFFIQKAIGWCLRQYAKYNPRAVEEFVEESNIQGLAKREALKHF